MMSAARRGSLGYDLTPAGGLHKTKVRLNVCAPWLPPPEPRPALPIGMRSSSWRRRRLRVPAGLVLHFADIGDADRASLSAVPVTAPLRAFNDCLEAHVASSLVRQAVLQARQRGIITAKDEARLASELSGRSRERIQR